MEQYFNTAIVAIVGMLAMLSVILGLDRMIKIIMANYLISSILLWLGNFIDLISNRLLIGEADRRVEGMQNALAWFLKAWKPTLLLTIYFVLLIFIVTKSHIWIGKIKNEVARFALTVLFLPCTVISILLGISLSIFWSQLVDLGQLQILAEWVEWIPYLYNFVLLTPVWSILPGIITIIVAAFILRTKWEPVEKDFVLDFDDDPAVEL